MRGDPHFEGEDNLRGFRQRRVHLYTLVNKSNPYKKHFVHIFVWVSDILKELEPVTLVA